MPRPLLSVPADPVLRRTAYLAARSGVLWGYVFGLVFASSSLGYVSAYPHAAERARLSALFGSNAGLAALVGPARRLQTVPGYTEWKSFMFLAVVGAVWGLLTSTRLLRGEEDAGRWEVMLAGPTTPSRATASALAGLLAGACALWLVTGAIAAVVGHSAKVGIAAGPAFSFALAVVCPAVVFMAVGAVTSQLAANRRRAAGYAGVVLGAAYGIRLVADSGSGSAWMRWLSPLGWAEQIHPLTGTDASPLVPMAALTALGLAVAVSLARIRDVGSGILPAHDTGEAHLGLLGGTTGLAARLGGPLVAAWTVAIAATGLLVGAIAKQGGSLLHTSTSVERVMGRLGTSAPGAKGYLGFVLLLVAWMVALAAVPHVTAARNEEADARLDNVLVRSMSRRHWLTGRIGIAVGAAVVGGLAAGLFTWIAAAADGAAVGFGSLLAAGIALVPPALCVLSAGILGFGVWPRATAVLCYGMLMWSLVLELIGGFFTTNHWLLDTSVFHHLNAAPAQGVDWTSAAVMVGAAALTTLAGMLAFSRRDLVSA